MTLWLDDLRPMPPGYSVWAKTADEAIAHLASAEFSACSLDHDLGDPVRTGYDVLLWMAETKRWCRDITVHTANPVGRADMLRLIERYAPDGVVWRVRTAK